MCKWACLSVGLRYAVLEGWLLQLQICYLAQLCSWLTFFFSRNFRMEISRNSAALNYFVCCTRGTYEHGRKHEKGRTMIKFSSCELLSWAIGQDCSCTSTMDNDWVPWYFEWWLGLLAAEQKTMQDFRQHQSWISCTKKHKGTNTQTLNPTTRKQSLLPSS